MLGGVQYGAFSPTDRRYARLEMHTCSLVVPVASTHGRPMEGKTPPVLCWLGPRVTLTFGAGTGPITNPIAAYVQTAFKVASATNLSMPFGLPMRVNFSAAVLCHSLTESHREHLLRTAKRRLPKTTLCVFSRDEEPLAVQWPHSRAVHS